MEAVSSVRDQGKTPDRRGPGDYPRSGPWTLNLTPASQKARDVLHRRGGTTSVPRLTAFEQNARGWCHPAGWI